MPVLTLTDVNGIAARGRPWTVRLEFTKCTPAKYWYATGRGLNELVETGGGSVGSSPVNQLIDFQELGKRVVSLLANGYTWASTPYIRMSKSSLDAVRLMPTTIPIQVAPAPVLNTPAIGSVIKPVSPASHAVIVRDGVKLTGYSIQDSSGNEICQMSPDDGLNFARKHDLVIKFV